MKKLSFVIPCYRSEHTLCGVVCDIRRLMEAHNDMDYEIILVDDCSPDGVWTVIRRLHEEDPRVTGIHLARNFGQHGALMAGYNHCTGDVVITLDDDGQTPVDQTFVLLDTMEAGGFDVVYGRYAKRRDSGFRKLGTALNNFMLSSLVGKPKEIALTSYFAARRFVIDQMCEYRNAFPYIWGLVLRTTKNIGNAVIRHESRQEGESGYTFSKLFSLWMNGFTAFSVKPLRLSAGVGVAFSLFGLVGAVFTIVYKLLHPETAAGYSSLMSVLLILGGLVLLSLGLIGEYVGRIYLCINATPQYVIQELLEAESAKGDVRCQ